MKSLARGLGLLIVFGFGALASGQPSADTNFFPIMPWNWMPNDPVALKRVRDCGFTLAGFVAPGTLDTCQKVGLKAIDRRPAHPP